MLINGQAPHLLSSAERGAQLAGRMRQDQCVSAVSDRLNGFRTSLKAGVTPMASNPKGICIHLFVRGIENQVRESIGELPDGIQAVFVDCAESGD